MPAGVDDAVGLPALVDVVEDAPDGPAAVGTPLGVVVVLVVAVVVLVVDVVVAARPTPNFEPLRSGFPAGVLRPCLLYTSDAADE